MVDLVNKVICEDVFNILPQIESESVNLIVVDPPYGIGYKDWDRISNYLEFSERWIKECFRLLKPTGSFYSFGAWSTIAEFKLLCDKYGKIKNWITWERTKGRGSSTNYKSMKEEILFYTKSDIYTWNEQKMLKMHIFPYVKDGKPRGWFTNEEGVRCRWTGIGNVWHYTVPFWNQKDYKGHPSQKPTLMYERIILTSSNENDIILEPFCGSAPGCISAAKLGRRFIGIENDKKWVNMFYDDEINIDETVFV